MPNRLKNIQVEFISLVSVPANKENLVLKKGGVSMFEIKKYDEERRVAYGIVYAPEVLDTQGDFADRFEIQKAAYEFMKNLRLKNVDINHDFNAVDECYVCESWIVKEGDSFFYDKVGAWAVGIKVDNDEVWQMCKDGKLMGLSMAGKAQREEVQKEDSIVRSIIDAIKSVIKTQKEEATEMKEEDVKKAMDEKAGEIIKSVNERLESALKELKETWDGFEKSVNEKIETLAKSRQSQENTAGVCKSLAEEIL